MDEPCPLCGGKGVILSTSEGGVLWSRPCKCMEIRAARKRLESSGLGDLLDSCTLKNFQTPDDWTRKALETAVDYCRNGRGSWLYISGPPGVGKTHLCTAVCRYLLKKGAPVRYMLWREDAPKLKALVNDAAAYEAAFRELAEIPVLYIDDFFKQRGEPSAGDVNLAFALLNSRYNAKGKRTILSSELPLRAVQNIDPAISSRIWQRAKGYTLNAPPDAANWRTKQA